MADEDLKVRPQSPTIEDSYLRGVKARLKQHSKAFEGLMSLIPADMYYGKDNSDQWQRKKQTKEERRAAKKAKLEPGATKTALDVHREREQQEQERKRKRDQSDSVDPSTTKAQDSSNLEDRSPKKVKVTNDWGSQPKNVSKKKDVSNAEEDEKVRQEMAEKRRLKRVRGNASRKAAKEEMKAERKKLDLKIKEEKKARASERLVNGEDGQTPKKDAPERAKKDGLERVKKSGKDKRPSKKSRPIQDMPMEEYDIDDEQEDTQAGAELEMEDVDDEPSFAQEQDGSDDSNSSITSSPEQETLFDLSANHSSASSSSSVVPPSNPSDADSKKLHQQSKSTSQKKQARANSSSTDENGESEEVFDAKIDLPMEESSSSHSESRKPVQNSPDALVSSSTQPNLKDSSGKQSNVKGEESSEPASTADTRLPKVSHEELTKRLADKIAALRAARNADGPDGKPAKNRAELIEARRRKIDLRKQRKKEERSKNRVAKNAEEEAARLRGGNGSPIWSASLYSPGGALANEPEPNLQYGTVAFDDGVEVDAGKGILKARNKKKGKSDVKTALLAAEKKRSRLAGYDADKRADIEEKDAWATAKNRVTGDKAKDDPNLLKKTIKKNDKAKHKSEKEWNDRQEGVRKGQEMRQHKREDNLRKRRELKGVKGKDRKKLLGKQKGKDGVQKQKPKQKKRPGFEGTFKTTARRT